MGMRRRMGISSFLDDFVRANDVVRLREVLTQNENINVNSNDNESKSTLLHTAATRGFVEITIVLLNAGANPKLQNWKGLTPAHLSAMNGKLDVLKILLSYDPTLINLTDHTGNTVLNLTANKGHEDVVEFLLKENADFEIKNKYQNTAYHSAVLGRRLKVLQVLFKYHPESIDKSNKEGNTPLHLAASKGYGSVIELLLSKGAKYTRRNLKNKTPLQLAQIEKNESVKVFRKFDCYKDIVAKCTAGMATLIISKRYDDDNTALHIAASFEGQYDIIGELVRSGANVNAHNCHNKTPLFMAVEQSNIKNVKKLVSCGGRVSEVELERGQTALHIASINHDLEILKVLTRKNSVDVNLVDKDKKTPLAYAVVHKSRHTVRHLLEQGADAGLKDSNGLNALHLSVLTKNTDITEDILSVADENVVNEQNVEGKSPLLLAVDRRSATFDGNAIKMIDILLQKGADPHKESRDGETAYSMAFKKGLDISKARLL